jgi:hypothetical protein
MEYLQNTPSLQDLAYNFAAFDTKLILSSYVSKNGTQLNERLD